MKHFCAIGTLLMMAVLAACDSSVRESKERPCRELEEIDSLLWTQPDSALTRLLLCYDTVSDRHYANLLLAELLYKNDYEQTNRSELLEAVAYYDSVFDPFLAARAHYINGVGYYERDSVVLACKEYLKAVETMEEHFTEKELVGKKAKFMAYSYNRLGELFSGQFIIESAIECYENALVYCKIEPTSPNCISNTLYRIGVLLDEKGETDKARSYFEQAMEKLKYTDNLLYRDIVSSKAIVDYQLGMDSKQVLDVLRMVIAQADNEKELLHRFLTIGAVYMGEGVYDSVLLYFVPVFQNEMSIASKIQVAESLRIIYDSLGNKEKTYEYVQFLASHKKTDGESKALVSKLDDVFQNYLIQKKGNQAKMQRTKTVKTGAGIVVSVVLVMALGIIKLAKRKSKKLLKQQQEETDKVLGEMEQEYAEERDSLRQDLEEREAQVISLEKALNQQHIEAQQQRAAFIKEPICQHILGKVRNKHITTRDNAYELGIALGDEEFMLLGAAVAKHYDGFDHKLLSRCASLKPNDLTLCHLSLLGLGEVAIAALKNRTYSAIKKQKESIEKKLGVEGDLSVYVLSVAEGVSVGQIEERSKKSTLKSMSEGTLKGIQKQIVDIIVSNPNVTIPLVASQLGRNPRGIARHFKTLQDKGVICRIGPDRGGHWEVVG